MSEQGPARTPAWLRGLGLLALAVLGLGLVYALAIGAANFARIGV